MATRITDLRSRPRDYAALDDRMLVLDFQAGDPEAFVEIHHRYGGLARHVCRRFLSNRQDADEAFQETMIRVFQGLYRFNGRYALQPWIARIATNVSLDQLRSAARRPQLGDGAIEDEEPGDPADGPEEAVERLVQRDLVLSVLADLPENHRTALVLRELEGRSHKEIAERLGITSGQAKALIHRAKGSFRRGWLLAVTEKGGFAGIAVLPLLWLAKVGDVAKRFVDRAGQASQVAQAATPEVVTAATSSPAVVTATASGIGERIVAAGMTILVAGSVTVGAVAINKVRHREEPRTAAAPSTAPVVQPAVEEPVTPPRSPEPQEPQKKTKGKGPVVAAVPSPDAEAAVESTPTVSPSVEPSTSPTASPSVPPSTTPPPIPPAPEWSLTFTSSVAVGTPHLEKVASRTTGVAGGQILFSQTAAGPIVDAKGRTTGRLYVDYWGSADGSDGTAGSWIIIDLPGGRYEYEATAELTSLTQLDGRYTYLFQGDYRLTEWPGSADGLPAAEGVPHEGFLSLTLHYWVDGTSLYGVELGLLEQATEAN